LHNKRKKVLKGPDGKDIQYKLCKPTLTAGAVPTIFPNSPEYLSDKTTKRKQPKLRIASTKTTKVELTEIHNYI